MTVGALCLCLVFALQLRGAEPLATPQRRRAAERQAAERTGNKAEETLDALLYLKDLPRGPAVAPHKKAPQFMLDRSAGPLPGATPFSGQEAVMSRFLKNRERS